MSKRIVCALLTLVLLIGLVPAAAVTASAAGGVNEKLVDMVIETSKFYGEAHKVGDGQYIIGYGTPSKAGQEIGKDAAKNVLRDYLNEINKNLAQKFPGMMDYQREAMVSFTFHNGYSWLDCGIETTVKEGNTNVDTFLYDLFRALPNGNFEARKREANLYLNAQYKGPAPANYCYVVLDPNGGSTPVHGNVMGYDSNRVGKINPALAPSRSGYTFSGWYTQSNGGSLVASLNASLSGKKLYAHWQKDGEGVDKDGVIIGVDVSYYLPAALATERDSLGRVKVFRNPADLTHIDTINPTEVVHIVSEYKTSSAKWVQIENSGWVKLISDVTVKTGTVELGPKLRLDIHEATESGTVANGTVLGALRNGDKVSIYQQKPEGKTTWGLTIFLDAKSNSYKTGWIDLKYVNMDGSTPGISGDGEMTGVVTSNMNLNVRKGPGAHRSKVGSLTPGTTVTIYETEMYAGVKWGKIGENQWVCMTYIKQTGSNGGSSSGNGSSSNSGSTTGGTQGRIVNCSSGVNVRANATPHSALQGVIPVGQLITILETTEHDGTEWHRTEKGWVCGLYVQKLGTPAGGNGGNGGSNSGSNGGSTVTPSVKPGTAMTGMVTGAPEVNVRSGAGVANSKVTSLRSGAKVNVYETVNVDGASWYRIDQGWIAANYVQLGGGAAGGNVGGTTQTAGGGHVTGVVASNGNLKTRAGAGFGYRETGDLKPGTKVTIYEQQFLDGVNWGRTEKGWVNMAFITMDSSGFTGTGSMGTVVKCHHAVRVRNAPGVGGAQVGTFLIGTRVEIMETTTIANGETWGRTAQGWVSMYYIQLDSEVPAPPIPPVNPQQPNVPANPSNPGNPVPPVNPQQPSNQGIPFNMAGTMNAEAPLRMKPSSMGDYEKNVKSGATVQISKLENADGILWGLVEGGWINMDKVDLDVYAVSNKAQIVWQDASTNSAIGALNQGQTVNISGLKLDGSNKVWGQINNPTGWIELTNITEPSQYKPSFRVKAITNQEGVIVRSTPAMDAEPVGDPLADGTPVVLVALQRDADGRLWANSEAGGWIDIGNLLVSSPCKVISKTLIVWGGRDQGTASGILNQQDAVTINVVDINAQGKFMGQLETGGWVELGGLTQNW